MRAMQRASKCASQTISSTRTYKLVYYLEVISLPFGLRTLDYYCIVYSATSPTTS